MKIKEKATVGSSSQYVAVNFLYTSTEYNIFLLVTRFWDSFLAMDLWDKIVQGGVTRAVSLTPSPLSSSCFNHSWVITSTCCQTWKLRQFYLNKTINVGCAWLGSKHWLIVPGPVIHNAVRSTTGILVNRAPDQHYAVSGSQNSACRWSVCVDTEDGMGDEQLSSHWVSGVFPSVGVQRKRALISPLTWHPRWLRVRPSPWPNIHSCK